MSYEHAGSIGNLTLQSLGSHEPIMYLFTQERCVTPTRNEVANHRVVEKCVRWLVSRDLQVMEKRTRKR